MYGNRFASCGDNPSTDVSTCCNNIRENSVIGAACRPIVARDFFSYKKNPLAATTLERIQSDGADRRPQNLGFPYDPLHSTYHGLEAFPLGLLQEVADAAPSVDLHQAEIRSSTAMTHTISRRWKLPAFTSRKETPSGGNRSPLIHGNARDRYVGTSVDVPLQLGSVLRVNKGGKNKAPITHSS